MSNSFQVEWEKPELESVASLAENLVIHLRGCDDTLLRKVLQTVYCDFCRRSCALTTKRRIEISEPTTEIPVSPCLRDTSVDVVKEVRIDRRLLVEGEHYRLFDGFVVFPTVYDRCVVEIVTVEIPNPFSEHAPRWFLKKYGEALSSGALAKMMSMAGKSWSDPERAKVELINYENFLTTARLQYYCGGDGSNGAVRGDGGELL